MSGLFVHRYILKEKHDRVIGAEKKLCGIVARGDGDVMLLVLTMRHVDAAPTACCWRGWKRRKGITIMDNINVTETEKQITLVIDKNQTIAKAGTETTGGKERKHDLVATSRGFASIGADFLLSLNVTRRVKTPAATE